MTHRHAALFQVALLVATLLSTNVASAFSFRHVFVANRGANGITELDENLTFVRNWFVGQQLGSRALNGPNGLAFSPDGSLFIADTYNSRVVVVSAAGDFVREFGVEDRIGQHIETINFDFAGNLYIGANPGNGAIARFASNGEFQRELVRGADWINAGNINFLNSGALVYAVYNTRGLGFRVLDRDTGELRATFGAGTMDQIEDMAIDGADVLLAAAWNHDQLIMFNADRTERRRLMLPRPTGVAITSTCKIIATSFSAGVTDPQLYVFSWDGQRERTINIPQLSLAESIAIVGQILPGSFSEFPPADNETTPACDTYVPIVTPETGVAHDGGAGDGATADVGSGDGLARGSRGGCCRCSVQNENGHRTEVGVLAFLMGSFMWLARRRRRGETKHV